MKFHVITELLASSVNTLVELQQQLDNECSTIRRVVDSLYDQSVSQDGLHSILKKSNELCKETEQLALMLKQVERIYDDTENRVLDTVNQLSAVQDRSMLAREKTLYCRKVDSPDFEEFPERYIKFSPVVSGILRARFNNFTNLFPPNINECPKILNKAFPLLDNQCDEWLKSKLLDWTKEKLIYYTNHIPYKSDMETINTANIFQ